MKKNRKECWQGSSILKMNTGRFWLYQFLGWSAVHWAFFVPIRSLAVQLGATTTEMIVAVQFGALVSILLSGMLGCIFAHLPESRLRGPKSLRVLTLCVCFATLGTGATLLFSWMTGIGPWLPPEVSPTFSFPLFLMLQGITTLGTWSAMFLVVLLAEQVQVERGRTFLASALANEAQLNMLRSQLNPHFLFNALNSVVGLIGEDSTRAEEMVRDIAALLRRSLDDTKKTNAIVKDEIEFIRLYLRCQKVRFEDQLQIEIEIPGDLEEIPFPSMLLHPLVENAVKHGMRQSEPLTIRVSATTEGQQVVFTVANNGSLVTNKRPTQMGTETGVRSIKERVAAIFPDDGEFTLEQEPGWVVARVRFTPQEPVRLVS